MERKFQLLPGTVQVFLEGGEAPDDIVPVLSDAALIAHTQHLQGLLVVSGLGDPANAAAVSRALEEIHAAGAPPPFKIAFVAYMFPQYSVYHFAEQYAAKFGIDAKVHVSVQDAMNWLGVREETRQPLPHG